MLSDLDPRSGSLEVKRLKSYLRLTPLKLSYRVVTN